MYFMSLMLIFVFVNGCKCLMKHPHNERRETYSSAAPRQQPSNFFPLTFQASHESIPKRLPKNLFKSFQTISKSKKTNSALLQDPQIQHPSLEPHPDLKRHSSSHPHVDNQGCLSYSIQEEQPAGMLVGDVFHDSHIPLKHTPDVLKSLKFFFLVKGQKSENLPHEHESHMEDKEFYSYDENNRFANIGTKQRKTNPRSKKNAQKHMLKNEEKNSKKSKQFSIGDLFMMEETTGILRTRRKIDREEVCGGVFEVCVLKTQVVVQPLNYFDMIKICIEITDLNDNPPTFPQKTFHHQISEAASVGFSFAIPSAQDKDTFPLFYYLFSFKHKSLPFKLESKRINGVSNFHNELRVVVAEQLDRENVERYEFCVVVVDSNNANNYNTDPHSIEYNTINEHHVNNCNLHHNNTLNVSISIGDVNDNTPRFDKELYETSVEENTLPNTQLLVLRATDEDSGNNGRVFYHLERNTDQKIAEKLKVPPLNGVVTLVGSLDYEEEEKILAEVVVSDGAETPLSSTATLLIHVIDVNDNYPKIEVNTLTGNNKALLTEEVEAGTFIAHLSVTDEDSGNNGHVKCDVHDPSLLAEWLYRCEYKLVSKKRLRWKVGLHEVRVTCSDLGSPPLNSTAVVVVDVIPVCSFSKERYVWKHNGNENPLAQVTAMNNNNNNNKNKKNNNNNNFTIKTNAKNEFEAYDLKVNQGNNYQNGDNYEYDNEEYNYESNNNIGSYKYSIVEKKYRKYVKIGVFSGKVSITKELKQNFPLKFNVVAEKFGGKMGNNVGRKDRKKEDNGKLQCRAEVQVLKSSERYYIWDEVGKKVSVLLKNHELVYQFNHTRFDGVINGGSGERGKNVERGRVGGSGGYGGDTSKSNTSSDECRKLFMVASFDNHPTKTNGDQVEVCLKMATYFNLIGSSKICAIQNLKFLDQLEDRIYSILLILTSNISSVKVNLKDCSELSLSSFHFFTSSPSSLSPPHLPLSNSTKDCINGRLCNHKYINNNIPNIKKSFLRKNIIASINNKHIDWSVRDRHTHFNNSYDVEGDDGGYNREDDDDGGDSAAYNKDSRSYKKDGNEDGGGGFSLTLILLSLFLLTIIGNISAIKVLRSVDKKVHKDNRNEI